MPAPVTLSPAAISLCRSALLLLLHEMRRDLARGRIPRADRAEHGRAMLEVAALIELLCDCGAACAGSA